MDLIVSVSKLSFFSNPDLMAKINDPNEILFPFLTESFENFGQIDLLKNLARENGQNEGLFVYLGSRFFIICFIEQTRVLSSYGALT